MKREGSGVARFGEYDYLLERVGGWSMADLDDLMLEIERDAALSEPEREGLLARLYALLWRRAQAAMGPSGTTVPPN